MALDMLTNKSSLPSSDFTSSHIDHRDTSPSDCLSPSEDFYPLHSPVSSPPAIPIQDHNSTSNLPTPSQTSTSSNIDLSRPLLIRIRRRHNSPPAPSTIPSTSMASVSHSRPSFTPMPLLSSSQPLHHQAIPDASGSQQQRRVVPTLDRETRPDPQRHGHIPGVPPGTIWPNRYHVSQAGVHAPSQAGISGTEARGGAESIVLNGGYPYGDSGNIIWYMGAGGYTSPTTGKLSKIMVCDQSLNAAGNKAMLASIRSGLPVRVVRGPSAKDSPWAPTDGYRYDGLYKSTKKIETIDPSGDTQHLCYVWRMERIVEPNSPYTIPVRVGAEALAAKRAAKGLARKRHEDSEDATAATNQIAKRSSHFSQATTQKRGKYSHPSNGTTSIVRPAGAHPLQKMKSISSTAFKLGSNSLQRPSGSNLGSTKITIRRPIASSATPGVSVASTKLPAQTPVTHEVSSRLTSEIGLLGCNAQDVSFFHQTLSKLSFRKTKNTLPALPPPKPTHPSDPRSQSRPCSSSVAVIPPTSALPCTPSSDSEHCPALRSHSTSRASSLSLLSSVVSPKHCSRQAPKLTSSPSSGVDSPPSHSEELTLELPPKHIVHFPPNVLADHDLMESDSGECGSAQPSSRHSSPPALGSGLDSWHQSMSPPHTDREGSVRDDILDDCSVEAMCSHTTTAVELNIEPNQLTSHGTPPGDVTIPENNQQAPSTALVARGLHNELTQLEGGTSSSVMMLSSLKLPDQWSQLLPRSFFNVATNSAVQDSIDGCPVEFDSHSGKFTIGGFELVDDEDDQDYDLIPDMQLDDSDLLDFAIGVDH